MIVGDELTHEPTSHTYWTKDGNRVVGITELLSAMGYLGKGFFNDEALRRGKNVHLALHYYAKGTLNPASLSPRIKPYFDCAMELITRLGAEIELSEALVFDPLARIACRLDAVWKIKNELIVVDYKSGVVGDWVKYQTAAHVNGLAAAVPYRRWGVQLKDDGNPAVITEFDNPKDLKTVRMFGSVFYTHVNDGIVKWPRTKADFEKTRSEDNGLDLFLNAGATTEAADRAIRSGDGSPLHASTIN